jgi:hypothetical protein
MKPPALTFTFRINGTLHVVLGTLEDAAAMEDQKAALRRKGRAAMLAGAEVEADGVIEWIEDVEQYPAQWDESGNRCLHARTHFAKGPAGLVKTVEKIFFRKPEDFS